MAVAKSSFSVGYRFSDVSNVQNYLTGYLVRPVFGVYSLEMNDAFRNGHIFFKRTACMMGTVSGAEGVGTLSLISTALRC